MSFLGKILFIILIVISALAINLYPWRPGIGNRRHAPGTELERFYGWPATYRAELWDSDDPTLVDRILKAAPFYSPDGAMKLQRSVIGREAVAVDAVFWGLVGVTLVLLSKEPATWRRSDLRTIISLTVILLGLYAIATAVEIGL